MQKIPLFDASFEDMNCMHGIKSSTIQWYQSPVCRAAEMVKPYNR